MSWRQKPDPATLLAIVGAAVIVAHLNAAKAARQTLFLASFSGQVAQDLPNLIIGNALFALLIVGLASRGLAAIGPARLVPAAFLGSAILHVVEWFLSFPYPKLVAIVIYLHLGGLGAALVSGFWSLVSERYDPHTARTRIVEISSGAAAGALAGGAIGWAAKSPAAVLPALCAMHLMCAWLARGFAAGAPTLRREEPETGGICAAGRLMGKHRYLRDMALLVLVGAAGANVLEVAYTVQAAEISPDRRLNFFALFFTVTSLSGCVVQACITRWLLETAGLGGAAGSRPAAIALGSLGAALVPGIGSAAFARGGEQVVLNSLFRSACELFYTPLPAAEKRTVKPLIDVGFERAGDTVGAMLVKCLALLLPGATQPAMLAAAAGTGLAGMWAARRLDRGYVGALARSLKNRVVELKVENVSDRTTRMTVLRTMRVLPAQAHAVTGPRPTPGHGADPAHQGVADLESGDPVRARRALESGSLNPEIAAYAITLLGWDETAEPAAEALRRAGTEIAPRLIDALLDTRTEFAIRRRIPRVLAAFPSAQARDGLADGLHDKRFEVRYRCGRALAAMLGADPAPAISADQVYGAVQKELAVDKGLWKSYRLLDRTEEDRLVGARADRGLEHVFTLLSLILPKEPLQISFYALHTEDSLLRGTALEYLDGVLPAPVRDRLRAVLGDIAGPTVPVRADSTALAALLASHESIQERLAALRAQKATRDVG